MALRTNNHPQVLTGDTIADRPPATSIPNAGVLFHDTATGDCSVSQIHADGTHVWEPFCGGGSGQTLEWPDYVVSLNDPLAPFTSIGAAIAAASGAGHGPSDPAVVLVHPGTYVENVVLRAGIAVVAFSQNIDIAGGTVSNTIIAGTVTCNAADTGLFGLTGFTVEGEITCAAAATLLLNYVNVTLGGSSDLLVFSGTGAVQISNSLFNNTGTGACIRITGAAALSILGSKVTGTKSQLALVFNQGSFNSEIRDSTVNGQIHLTNSCSLVVDDTDTAVTSTPQYQLDKGTTVQVNGGSFAVSPDGTNVVAGQGSYFFNNTVSTASEFLADVALNPSPAMTSMRGYSRTAPTPGIAVVVVTPDFDLWEVTVTGPTNADLPDIRTAMFGQRITIKNGTGTAAITVVPAAGDTIEGSAGTFNIPGGGPPFHAATFQANITNRNWIVVAVV
jgi:hypothetical protein